jgi:hypothetical protein
VPSVDKMTTGVMVIACNWQLLNDANYHSPSVIKRLLRKMISLEHYARKGDTVAQSILIDLTDAIEADQVLTFKQRKYLKLWLDGYRQIDIAAMHRRSQNTVSMVIDKGVSNISVYLR